MLIKCYWFELVSQLSNVGHGPFVLNISRLYVNIKVTLAFSLVLINDGCSFYFFFLLAANAVLRRIFNISFLSGELWPDAKRRVIIQHKIKDIRPSAKFDNPYLTIPLVSNDNNEHLCTCVRDLRPDVGYPTLSAWTLSLYNILLFLL